MKRKGLLILVEGSTDFAFFQTKIMPLLSQKYESVSIIEYSELSKREVESWIKSFQYIGWDYLFVADKNKAPCLTKRKQDLKKIYDCLDSDKIIIVEKEIESWYLAGMGEKLANDLGIKIPPSTDKIAKKAFERLTRQSLRSIDFRQMLLENFCLDAAQERNKSFAYFLRKLKEDP
jgi:hypothetical protein